ncbi:hypothetical protein V4F39_16480 [Aquincola sp. MAHUQ-54]|uniref:Apea-like HEPN domain-containing protein n=2 Tax=Aquincola agrisoli TaxID=3119538 RepID=A0AAW9QHA1_9BURK
MAAYDTADGKLATRLGLVYYESSLFAFVMGTEGSPADDNLKPWIEAVAYAERLKSIGHPTHAWLAAIGPSSREQVQTPRFDDIHLDLGDINLQSCGFSYEERRAHSSLCSWSSYKWVPLEVHGTSRGHHWQSADFNALRQLHRLCAVLTVETGVHWALKESPRPAEWGPIQFPESTPLGLEKKENTYDESGLPAQACEAIDADRLTRMWKHSLNDESVGAPIEAYYQAASLRDSHPSFSLVGFVAAIEEVGKLLIAQPKGEQCPTCGRERTSSSAQRFRAALRLVLPEDKIKDVSSQLYRWRSGTAHSGRTYSWESSFGRPQMGDSLLVSQPQSMFGVRGTMRADELARDLIIKPLDGNPIKTQSENSAG